MLTLFIFSGSENYLIREFGLTVVTRGFSPRLFAELEAAYAEAEANGTWTLLVNVYDYFMKATQAWFNGASMNVNLGN